MTKLELLNVFLNDRLTAAADEIFRAVKETVAEYQSEALRSKEENERLKRLLNVAVQRLLLQAEPHSVQPRDAAQPLDADWRGGAELLPRVKEEPGLGDHDADFTQEGDDATGRKSSHVERRSRPPPAQTACSRETLSPAALASEDIKTDGPAGGVTSPDCRATAGDAHVGPAKTHRTPKPHLAASGGQQVKGLLCSNGKQSAKPARSFGKQQQQQQPPPPPRPGHQNQSMQRWHSCRECGKGFSFACQLEVHMRWHTKEKPYSCTVCRKSFTTVSMLKRHHRIHTGEKPFRCHVCGKCFNQSAHLNTHFRLHTRERAGWSRAPHARNAATPGS